MNFIDREKELETLNKEYKKDNSFVVLYGRRRVGKTTLIKEFIKDKKAFYFFADRKRLLWTLSTHIQISKRSITTKKM